MRTVNGIGIMTINHSVIPYRISKHYEANELFIHQHVAVKTHNKCCTVSCISHFAKDIYINFFFSFVACLDIINI